MTLNNGKQRSKVSIGNSGSAEISIWQSNWVSDPNTLREQTLALQPGNFAVQEKGFTTLDFTPHNRRIDPVNISYGGH